ncbi:MAG: hypothetical protein KJ709_05605 [Nanoarchaeota archaeon]|nr:hypothetical protein [Nanoarchaeota archaeon]
MHGKRGAHTEEMAWPIISMIIVIVVIFMGVGEKIHHLGDSDVMLANFYARDIALLIDAAGAGVSDLSMRYPHDLEGFTVELQERMVIVRKGDTEGSYPVRNPHNLNVEEGTNDQPYLTIYSAGDRLGFGDRRLNTLRCPDVQPAYKGFDKVILDPRDGVMEKVAQWAINRVKGGIETTEALMETEERRQKMATFRFGITLASAEGDMVKAYIDASETGFIERQGLACKLVNHLGERFGSVAVVPIDMELLDEDDPRQILPATQRGIYIEMGENAEDPKTGEAIVEALEDFFEG